MKKVLVTIPQNAVLETFSLRLFAKSWKIAFMRNTIFTAGSSPWKN